MLAALGGRTDQQALVAASSLDFADPAALAAWQDTALALADPAVHAAGTLAAAWFESCDPTSSIAPAEPLLPLDGKVRAAAIWAASPLPDGTARANDEIAVRLSQAIDRWATSGHRDTIARSVIAERGARWARICRPGACGFCRMLAGRGAVYRTAHTAKQGHEVSRGHGRCHCVVVPIRPGDPAPIDLRGELHERVAEYQRARATAVALHGHGASLNQIAALMREDNPENG